MTLRVTVTDLETGDEDTKLVRSGDYMLVVHDPCHPTDVLVFDEGRTHVVVVKDRIPH